MDKEMSFLASGGFGALYLLKNVEPPTVIKCLHQQHGYNAFKTEIQALEQLKHEHIVQYFGFRHDFVNGRETFGILMEYCENGSLKSCVFKPSLIYTWCTAICWAEQILKALTFLHEKERIHRDIKADNILVTGDHFLKLGDFGTIKSTAVTCSGTYAGTKRYMSPEMLQNQKVSPKSDVYGAGLVFWEIMERRTVFSDTTHFESWFERDFQTISPMDCFEDYQELVYGCANFDYKKRWSANEALQFCEKLKENNVSPHNPYFRPYLDDEQKVLLKPIGFNLLRDKVPVKTETDGFNDENFRPPGISKTFTTTITSKQSSRSLFKVNPNVKKLCDHFSRLKEYFDNEPERTFEAYEELIQNKRNEVEIFVIFGDDFLDDAKKRVEKDLHSENWPHGQLIMEILEQDFLTQKLLYVKVFKLIEFVKETTFYYQPLLQQAVEFSSALKALKENQLTKVFHFRSYFLTSSKDEWLYIGNCFKKNQKKNNFFFIRKDLNEAKMLQMTWMDDELNEFQVQDSNAQGEVYEMHYLQLGTIEVDLVIAALDRLTFRIEAYADFMMEKIRPSKKYSQPRYEERVLNQKITEYVYQLGFPPTIACKCGLKCENFGFPENLPERFQVLLPNCASNDVVDCLKKYLEISNLFLLSYQASREKLNFSERIQSENALKTLTTNSQASDDDFSFYETTDENGNNLILLDCSIFEELPKQLSYQFINGDGSDLNMSAFQKPMKRSKNIFCMDESFAVICHPISSALWKAKRIRKIAYQDIVSYLTSSFTK